MYFRKLFLLIPRKKSLEKNLPKVACWLVLCSPRYTQNRISCLYGLRIIREHYSSILFIYGGYVTPSRFCYGRKYWKMGSLSSDLFYVLLKYHPPSVMTLKLPWVLTELEVHIQGRTHQENHLLWFNPACF